MGIKILDILKRKSTKDVGLYTATGFGNKAVSFIALLFFINVLSEGDMGILNIFSTSIVFLTPVVSLGTLYTISVEYFNLSKRDYSVVFSTSILIPLVAIILLAPVLLLFHEPLSKTFQYQPQFIWLIPICLLFNFCAEAFTILLRMENKVKLFVKVSMLKTLLEVAFSFFFIFLIYTSWFGRALGYAVSLSIIALLFLFYIIKNSYLVKTFSVNVLKKELLFGLAGLLLQVGIFSLNSSDKFFVMARFGKDIAGFYGVASTFATIQYILAAALLQYLQPIIFSAFSKGKSWPHLKFTFKKFILSMIGALLVIIFCTTIIYNYFIKESYKQYINLFYLLSISTLIWSISNLFLQNIIFQKNKKILSIFSIVAIMLPLSINYFSSKYLEISWLCIGQITSNFLILLIILHLNKRLKFFDY